jgi:hypothetical protein
VAINVILAVCFYIPIIFREEKFLLEKYALLFESYARRTPALIPRLRLWVPPALRFNIARVIRREHDTLMSTVATFFVLETLREYGIYGRLIIDHV